MYRASGDDEEFERASRRIKDRTATLKSYCNNNGLTYRADRVQVVGYGRSVSASVNATNRKAPSLPPSVEYVGKINRDIFSCVTPKITTDDVIITLERIAHIKERHPNDYERYRDFMRDMVENPQFIIEANKPYTTFIVNQYENGEQFRMILRLNTPIDPPNNKNSIITFQYMRAKEYRRLINNKKILYTKE